MKLTEAIDLAGMSSELDEMTIDEVTVTLREAVRRVQALANDHMPNGAIWAGLILRTLEGEEG